MPTTPEYLRTAIYFDEGAISSFVVYGMRPLRVKTSVFDKVLADAQEKALQMLLEGHDPEYINRSTNHTINEAVAEMIKNGEGFASDPYQGLEVTAYLSEFHTWSYVYSHDGYSFFNPAQFHPGVSNNSDIVRH